MLSRAQSQTSFWHSLSGPGKGTVTHLVVVPVGMLYAGTDSGLFVSSDDGESWSHMDSGLTETHITAMAMGPSGSLYAGTSAPGLFRLAPGSDVWSTTTFVSAPVTAIAVSDDGMMALGTYGALYTGHEGSSAWSYIYENRFYNEKVCSLYLTPTDDIVAGGDQTIGWYKAGDPYWHSENGYMTNTLSIIPTPLARILFGGSKIAYLNDLENWAQSLDGCPNSNVIALATNQRGRLFAATADSGVYLSDNNGDSWVALSGGLQPTSVLALVMTPDGILYAGSADGFVYKSTPTNTGLVSPIKIYPRNDTADMEGPVVFRWRNAIGGTMYHLQVSSDSLFNSYMAFDESVGDTLASVSGLEGVTKFYWRVRTQNGIDTSAYSGVWHFITGPLPPAPVLLAPPDSAVDQPAQVLLRWSAVPRAISYNIETSGYPGFYWVTSYETADTILRLGGLQPNIHVYWHVRATNLAGTGSFSEVRSFATITPPQIPPNLEAPQSGARDLPVAVPFVWQHTSDATSFDFQLTDKGQFDSLWTKNDSMITDTGMIVSGLRKGTEYLWRVRGRNVWGVGPYSLINSFRTIIAPPAMPQLVAPANGSTNTPTLYAKLVWISVPSTDAFRVQVSRDSLFLSIIKDNDNVQDTLWSPGYLLENTQYYWRVNARNIGGVSPWSQVFNFRTVHEGNAGSGSPQNYYVLDAHSLPPSAVVFRYGIPVSVWVKISVFNSIGMKIGTAIDQSNPAGYFETVWRMNGLPSGIYYYTVQLGDIVARKKFLFIK